MASRPDLPGCFSAGATVDEALAMVLKAIELHLIGLLVDGERVPPPGEIERHRTNPQYKDGVWAIVSIDPDRVGEAATRRRRRAKNTHADVKPSAIDPRHTAVAAVVSGWPVTCLQSICPDAMEQAPMPHTIQLELELPADLDRFRLPAGVNDRLQELLDRQDRGETLSDRERDEADGLVNLAEFLSILRLRAERVQQSSN